MTEYRVYHLVDSLLHLLGIESQEKAEEIVEKLRASTHQNIPLSVLGSSAKSLVARRSPDGGEFLDAYEATRQNSPLDADFVVFLASKVGDDPVLQSRLARAKVPERKVVFNVAQTTNTREQTVPLTEEGLHQLRAQLGAHTQGSQQHMSTALTVTTDIETRIQQAAKKERNTSLPPVPSWSSRSFLLHAFATSSEQKVAQVRLGSYGVDLQETLLLEDLLSLLMGVKGRYVMLKTGKDGSLSFSFDETLDASLHELLRRVLPLCSHYALLIDMINEGMLYRRGTVYQALCARIRTVVKEYLVLVAQLEHQFRQGHLTLHKVVCYTEEFGSVFEFLASLATLAKREVESAALLTFLHERVQSTAGDALLHRLALSLITAASLPYFEMLQQWLYKGTIADAYSEFFVQEDMALRKEDLMQHYNDHYWTNRYTIVSERIPSFLQKVSNEILNTGKYLNAIRQCGRPGHIPDGEEVLYNTEERLYVGRVLKAFRFASSSLVTLLVAESHLIDRLRSIKSYFLMSQGDFFLNFMDIAAGELGKELGEIEVERISSLVELAQRTSSAKSDPHGDSLRCTLVPCNLITELFRIMNVSHDHKGNERGGFMKLGDLSAEVPAGIEATHIKGYEGFTFDYNVEWPLSLVLSKKAVKRYQLLFRHLFYCKHVERVLSSSWLEHQYAKQYRGPSSQWLRSAFGVRQQMLHFVQNFEYYMIFEVIEPNWHLLEKNIAASTSVEEVMQFHNGFLDTCLKECMLTNPSLLKITSKLFSICTIFSHFMTRAARTVQQNDPKYAHLRQHSKVMAAQTGEGSDKDFAKNVQKFEEKFTEQMRELLDTLERLSSNESEQHMLTIAARLNFNDYYTKSSSSSSS